MATLSSLTGGSSGGGGGDPSGKFQASATVANGDLVVLNDNGTVAPVTSTAIADDFAKSNNGIKLYAGSTNQSYGMFPFSGNYNQTHNKYLIFYRQSSGNYGTLKSYDYDSSSENFTNASQRLQTSMYASWLSQKRSPSEGYLLGYRATNGYQYVRGQRWNGSNWSTTSEGTATNSSNSSTSCYISASGDGSSSFAMGCALGNGEFSMAHGTWDGSNTTPVMSHGTDAIYTQRPSNTSSGTKGTNWSNNSFAGCHIKNDVHIMVGEQANVAIMVAAKVEATGTTYGTKKNTGLTFGAAYGTRVIYDEETNIGVWCLQVSGVPYYLPFSVDVDTLDITTYSAITLPSGFTGYGSGLGWNPFIKLWVAVDHVGGEIFYWKLASNGAVSETGTGQFAPNAPNLSSLKLQFAQTFPVYGSGGMGIIFNNDHVVGGGGAGSYMDTTNHLNMSRFDLPYVSENMDKHFGEAKEAIASGAAGSVGILNRSVDITGSSFQKGQKLFANPSGTALATSGTYRVGHATDSDTVLVLGDPS